VRLAIAVAAAVLVTAAPAAAWPATPPPVAIEARYGTWAELPVPAYASTALERRALQAWNDFAGVEVFTRATRTAALVTIGRLPVADPRTGISWPVASNGVLRSCTADYRPGQTWSQRILIHELGHCLGFTDSMTAVEADAWAVQWSSDPGFQTVCDDRRDPRWSAYAGVMSYCGPRALNADDYASLDAAGYLP
jgi:hypothetical protein